MQLAWRCMGGTLPEIPLEYLREGQTKHVSRDMESTPKEGAEVKLDGKPAINIQHLSGRHFKPS